MTDTNLFMQLLQQAKKNAPNTGSGGSSGHSGSGGSGGTYGDPFADTYNILTNGTTSASTTSATSTCATCARVKKESEFSPIDLQNNKDSYEVWVNIPGFVKECLEITIKDKVLKITGKKPVVNKPNNLTIARRPSCDEFTYQVKLGTPVDASKTENSIVAGVLYLKLVKSEPDEGVRIAI